MEELPRKRHKMTVVPEFEFLLTFSTLEHSNRNRGKCAQTKKKHPQQNQEPTKF